MQLSNLFRTPNEAPASIPPGLRVYAIGDVHGRDDLLDELLAGIAADCRSTADARVMIVFLGDYIDRGLGSKRVLERLVALEESRCETIFLLGNHEAALLDFLARPETGRFWLSIGGAETLYSYGVAAPNADAEPSVLIAAAQSLQAAMPAAHIAFLQRLRLTVRIGDYLFVHAGLRPGRPLEAQSRDDLLEIREPFLSHRGRLPFVVVHGHTPGPDVHVDARRIGVDTGAYATGRLSAIRLEGVERAVLST